MPTDAKQAPKPADNSAGQDALSEEQLWKEIAASEKSRDDDDEPIHRDVDDPPEEIEKADTDPNPDASSEESETTGNEAEATPDPDQLQAQIDRLQHQLSSEKGRVRGTQQRAQRLQAELEAARKAQSSSADESRAERRKKIEETASQYDDFAPLVEEVSELRTERDAALEARVKDLEAQQAEFLEEQNSLFLAEHPDGYDVLTNNWQTFEKWIEKQSPEDRQIFETNRAAIVDGSSAALLIGRFKHSLATAEQGAGPDQARLDARRQRQLAGGTSLRSPASQSATSRPSPNDPDPASHWKFWASQERRSAR